jgi:hypothetical protein
MVLWWYCNTCDTRFGVEVLFVNTLVHREKLGRTPCVVEKLQIEMCDINGHVERKKLFVVRSRSLSLIQKFV